MPEHSKPFVIARNKLIIPKEQRVERVPPGYAVREFQNDPRGCYWYVVTALEVRTGGSNRLASDRGGN